jgi:hypothetical protein
LILIAGSISCGLAPFAATIGGLVFAFQGQASVAPADKAAALSAGISAALAYGAIGLVAPVLILGGWAILTGPRRMQDRHRVNQERMQAPRVAQAESLARDAYRLSAADPTVTAAVQQAVWTLRELPEGSSAIVEEMSRLVETLMEQRSIEIGDATARLKAATEVSGSAAPTAGTRSESSSAKRKVPREGQPS